VSGSVNESNRLVQTLDSVNRARRNLYFCSQCRECVQMFIMSGRYSFLAGSCGTSTDAAPLSSPIPQASYQPFFTPRVSRVLFRHFLRLSPIVTGSAASLNSGLFDAATLREGRYAQQCRESHLRRCESQIQARRKLSPSSWGNVLHAPATILDGSSPGLDRSTAIHPARVERRKTADV
jgi:hypothetical protein